MARVGRSKGAGQAACPICCIAASQCRSFAIGTCIPGHYSSNTLYTSQVLPRITWSELTATRLGSALSEVRSSIFWKHRHGLFSRVSRCHRALYLKTGGTWAPGDENHSAEQLNQGRSQPDSKQGPCTCFCTDWRCRQRW